MQREKYSSNVKDGTTPEVPILVSRVAPNTPRLTEGDQLIMINHRGVQHPLHADVVAIIQEAHVQSTEGK